CVCALLTIHPDPSLDCTRLSSPRRCFYSTPFHFLRAPRTSSYLHPKSSFHQSSAWLSAVIDGLGENRIMAVFCRNLNAWHRAARLATFVMAFTAVGAVVARAQTQNPPYSLFQYSTLTSSGNTITAGRVPLVTAAGKT